MVQGARVHGGMREDLKAARATDDHAAKSVLKAAYEPAESGSPSAVRRLKFIILISI